MPRQGFESTNNPARVPYRKDGICPTVPIKRTPSKSDPGPFNIFDLMKQPIISRKQSNDFARKYEETLKHSDPSAIITPADKKKYTIIRKNGKTLFIPKIRAR